MCICVHSCAPGLALNSGLPSLAFYLMRIQVCTTTPISKLFLRTFWLSHPISLDRPLISLGFLYKKNKPFCSCGFAESIQNWLSAFSVECVCGLHDICATWSPSIFLSVKKNGFQHIWETLGHFFQVHSFYLTLFIFHFFTNILHSM